MDFETLKKRIEQRGVAPNLGSEGEGWNMSQQPDELAHFLSEMLRIGVTSALEIGSGSGGLSRFMAEELEWRVTTIDTGEPGNKSDQVQYIRGDSKIVDIPEKDFDLIFIDGDHSYEGVSSDYRRFRNKAKKAIAFHDVTGLTGCIDVQRFWFELAYDPETKNLRSGCYQVSHSDPHAAPGIGWIIVDDFHFDTVLVDGSSDDFDDIPF